MKKILLATAVALLALPAQAEYQTAHRGGTMRLVARSAAGTVDPMINYTLQYFKIYQWLNDGLMASKKAAGADGFSKVPDLAEAMPEVSADGKTYVFKLRKGIKFSNGADLTTKDVVASFQRVFKVSSPTAGGFYSVIVGAGKCLATAATCVLEGVVGDEAAGTVTITLTRPDAEFLDKLALPHASILPADAPVTDAGTAPIPGTGAYMISAYDPNTGMTMSRNPNFKVRSEAGQPDGYPDVIQHDFGLTCEAEVNAVMNARPNGCSTSRRPTGWPRSEAPTPTSASRPR